MVLLGEFDLPDFSWKDKTVGCSRFRRPPGCVEEYFLTQMVYGQRVGDGLLDLLLTNKEELDRDVIINSSLGCSDYKELAILTGVKTTSSGAQT